MDLFQSILLSLLGFVLYEVFSYIYNKYKK